MMMTHRGNSMIMSPLLCFFCLLGTLAPTIESSFLDYSSLQAVGSRPLPLQLPASRLFQALSSSEAELPVTLATAAAASSSSSQTTTTTTTSSQTTSTSSSSASSSSPHRPASSLPPRQKQHSRLSKSAKKKAPKASRSNSSNKHAKSARVLSEQDLADHVSQVYIHGPGGVLQKHARGSSTRQRVRNARQPGGASSSSSSFLFLDDDDEEEEAKQEEDYEDEDDFPASSLMSSASSSSPSSSTLNRLNHRPALVLNADYQPLSVLPLSLWHWQEAVKAIFSGKVTVVDVYPDVTIRAATLEIPLPSVIALNEYVSKSKQCQQYAPSFTKRNVFLRDEYRCQYCLDRFHTRDLSLDHVVPRCHGGRLDWTNVVTCCHACNGRKGSLPLSHLGQVGMKLQGRAPRIPSQYELAAVANRMLPRRVHPTWEPYLGISNNQRPNPSSGSNGAGGPSSKSSSSSNNNGESGTGRERVRMVEE